MNAARVDAVLAACGLSAKAVRVPEGFTERLLDRDAVELYDGETKLATLVQVNGSLRTDGTREPVVRALWLPPAELVSTTLWDLSDPVDGARRLGLERAVELLRRELR